MTETPGIELGPLVDQVIAQIRELEQEVLRKTAELADAREKLAQARGKMDMLGIIQQLAQRPMLSGDPLLNGDAPDTAPPALG